MARESRKIAPGTGLSKSRPASGPKVAILAVRRMFPEARHGPKRSRTPASGGFFLAVRGEHQDERRW